MTHLLVNIIEICEYLHRVSARSPEVHLKRIWREVR